MNPNRTYNIQFFEDTAAEMDIEWSARETEIYGCLNFLDLWIS